MALRYDAGEVVTAMVTPMNANREVDYNKAEELAKYLANNGSESLLVARTTGESPTLTHEEELQLLSTIQRASAGKATDFFGDGSNSTATAVKMTKLDYK